MRFARKLFPLDYDPMLITLALWMCALPLVAMIVVPLFGKGAALLTALVLFVVMLLISWGICGWKMDCTHK